MNNEKKKNYISGSTVYICDDFDDSIIHLIPSLIDLIDREKSKKSGKIIFIIDSNGGFTDYLKILLFYVEKAKSEGIIVETNVYAKAYSCGSILAMSGTMGHRNVSEYAEHLMHFGSGNIGTVRTPTQLDRSSERMIAHFEFIKNIYKKYAKVKDLNKALNDDNYFIRGKDIIENGLADNLV